jgi:hypothetical protein
MSFTSLQSVEFMAIAAGQAQGPVKLPEFSFLLANYTGNARAKLWGKKGAWINYRKIKENHWGRGIFPRRLAALFCQDFLQCVKA